LREAAGAVVGAGRSWMAWMAARRWGLGMAEGLSVLANILHLECSVAIYTKASLKPGRFFDEVDRS